MGPTSRSPGGRTWPPGTVKYVPGSIGQDDVGGPQKNVQFAGAEFELSAAVERDSFAHARVVEVEESLHRAEARRLAVQAFRPVRQRLDVAPLVDRGIPGDAVGERAVRGGALGSLAGVEIVPGLIDFIRP